MGFGKKQKHPSGVVPELGAIFMSNRATKKLCITRKIFGLPYSRAGFVKHVKAGMFLFLFEHETRMLYGVYQACGDGAMNLSSEAFRSSGNKYPAQVKVTALWHCKPLTEDEFRPAIKDNYFAAYKFNFGLSKIQVRELLLLFNSRRVADELSRLEILPSNPYLIRGSSSFTGDDGETFARSSKYEDEQENASAFELHKNRDNFSMPYSEVDDRLSMDGNKVTVYEEASGTTSPRLSNYIDGSSDRYDFTQTGEMFYHGYNPDRDCVPKFSSGSPRAPFLTGNKGIRVSAGYVHNDRLSVQNIPATRHLQSLHHSDRSTWDGAYDAASIVNAGPLINDDGIQTFAGHNCLMRDTHYVGSDSNVNSVPYHPISLPEIGSEVPVDELRKPSPSCYPKPMISNSLPSCPVYRDEAVCEGPCLYDPGYGTSPRARGNYSEVLNSSNSTGNLHGNIKGVRDPLSEEYPSPPETSAFILRQSAGNIHGGNYQEVLNSSNSTGNLHGNIHGVRDSLSEDYPSPPETSAFILRQSLGRPGTSGTIPPPISSGYTPASKRIEYLGSENYEDAQLNSSAFSLAPGRENSGPPACVDIRGPVDVNQDSKFHHGREPTSQNRRSVFSRLKPALDADDTNGVGFDGKDAQNNIDSMVTEVMETLSGHYSQLLRQMSSETKQNVDDDDGNCASKIAKFEPPVLEETDFPTADEHVEAKFEKHHTTEMPRITFKRRSEAHKTRDAVEGGLSENSCAISPKKLCKRRKLVGPRLTDKKQNEDAIPDKTSPDMVSSLPSQDGSSKTCLPSSRKEWNPPRAVSLGVSAASNAAGCSNGSSSMNKSAGGRSEIGATSEPEKQGGQALFNPAASGIILEKPTEPCNSASLMLAATVVSSMTSSQNPKTDGKEIFDDANAESHRMVEAERGADLPPGNAEHGGSYVDPSASNLDKDGRTQTRLMTVGGNQVVGGSEIGRDMNAAPLGDDREGVPVAKKELGELLANFTGDVVGNSNRPTDLNLTINFDAEEDTRVQWWKASTHTGN